MFPLKITWPPRRAIWCRKWDTEVDTCFGYLAPEICNAHEVVLRVLSIAVSIRGIAHLRDVMNGTPVDVAHLLKDVWKEHLLRGVWGSSRCDW